MLNYKKILFVSTVLPFSYGEADAQVSCASNSGSTLLSIQAQAGCTAGPYTYTGTLRYDPALLIGAPPVSPQSNQGAQVVFNGDISLNTTPIANLTRYTLTGIGVFGKYNGANASLTANNIDIIMGTPTDGSNNIGISANFGGAVKAKTVTMHIGGTSNDPRNAPINYAVLAGHTVMAGNPVGASQWEPAIVEIENANITMTDDGNNSFAALHGLRAIKNTVGVSNTGSYGIINITDTLNINVAGGASYALYASGGKSQINLRDSEITVSGLAGKAMQIGKSSDAGQGTGLVTSSGHLKIDTTGVAIIPFYTIPASISITSAGSALLADTATSSAEIVSSARVIEYMASTYLDPDRDNNALTARFNNAVMSTRSSTATLIYADSGVTDAQFGLKGQQSKATAANNGWLFEVAGSGKLTATVADGANLYGLVNKAANATLDLNLDNAAAWQLVAKGSGQIATFSTLNLTRKAAINAFGTTATPAAFILAGNVSNNNGIINLSNNRPGDTLTLRGNYVGSNNGGLLLDTVLKASGSASDRIINDGGTITGTTAITINNTDVTRTGEMTEPGHGIKLVRSINNGTTSANAFILNPSASNAYQYQGQTAIGAGAYAYFLYKGANPQAASATDDYGETNLDEDWYLRSRFIVHSPHILISVLKKQYQPGAPTYEVYPQSLLYLSKLPTLQQRIGNRSWRMATGYTDATNTSFTDFHGLWGRVEKGYQDMHIGASETDATYNTDATKSQIGYDWIIGDNASGQVIGGLGVHYNNGRTNVDAIHGDGRINTNGYGVNATLTWYGNAGHYIDTQASYTWYKSDLFSRLSGQNLVSRNQATTYATSVEAGKRYGAGDGRAITPQLQLSYTNVDFDSFTDQYSGNISMKRGESLIARLGVALEKQRGTLSSSNRVTRSNIYTIANLYYEFTNGTEVELTGATLFNRPEKLWAGLGVGGAYNWDDDHYAINGEASLNTSVKDFSNNYNVQISVGFRARF